MKLKAILLITVGMFTMGAVGEPVEYSFDGDSDNVVLLHQIDSSLPMIQLREDFTSDFVTFGSSSSPLIIEWPSPGNGASGSSISVQVPSTINFMNGELYGDRPGTVIDGSLPGWSETRMQRCDDFECTADLPSVYGTGSPVDPCQDCRPDSTGLEFDELRYIPFRWKPIGDPDWMYGWVSFRLLFNTQACTTCIPGFPDFNLTIIRLDYVGIGLETEPNTPIFAGGFCTADLNLDSQIDFFDISEFLTRYSNGNQVADINQDGSIDFFDISEFLGYINGGCKF